MPDGTQVTAESFDPVDPYSRDQQPGYGLTWTTNGCRHGSTIISTGRTSVSPPTEHRQLLASWDYREKGLYPAGGEALEIFADELMGLSRGLAGSGALWRERIESLYLNARATTDAAGLEILTVQDGEFLIGDVPALTARLRRRVARQAREPHRYHAGGELSGIQCASGDLR